MRSQLADRRRRAAEFEAERAEQAALAKRLQDNADLIVDADCAASTASSTGSPRSSISGGPSSREIRRQRLRNARAVSQAFLPVQIVVNAVKKKNEEAGPEEEKSWSSTLEDLVGDALLKIDEWK